MTTLEILKDYRKRAKRIAILKAALCGIFVGFCVNFLLAFILLFCHVGALAVLLGSIIPGVSVGVLSSFLFYFLKFSPSAKKVASMVDNLGLEERVITMLESENETSEIARLQRKDATEKLNQVNPNMFRFRLPVAMLAALIVVCILSISMTAVSALTSAHSTTPGNMGEVTDPNDPSHNPEKEIEYVELYYNAGEGGSLMGETYQRIVKGTDASPVIAVAEEGYVFDQWDDGVMTSERWDWSVVEDINVTAVFVKKPEQGGEGEGEGEGQGEGEGEGQGEGEGEGQGEGEGEGEGEGQGEGEGEDKGQGQGEGEGAGEGEGEGAGDNQGSNSGKEESAGGGGGGAGWGGPTDNNSVIDGSTDYKDATDYEAEKEAVENDDSLPPELKDALSGYFDGMKP